MAGGFTMTPQYAVNSCGLMSSVWSNIDPLNRCAHLLLARNTQPFSNTFSGVMTSTRPKHLHSSPDAVKIATLKKLLAAHWQLRDVARDGGLPHSHLCPAWWSCSQGLPRVDAVARFPIWLPTSSAPRKQVP